MYNHCISPALTYRAGTWKVTMQLKKSIEDHTACVRRKKKKDRGVTLKDQDTAAWMREQIEIANIVADIQQKYTLMGHACVAGKRTSDQLEQQNGYKAPVSRVNLR